MFFATLLCVSLLGAACPSRATSSSLAHVTGCGCTTTTTCSPPPGAGACTVQSRMGKRGPAGPKGDKGDVALCQCEAVPRMESSISVLQEEINDLKLKQDLYFSFPSNCSEYIRHESATRKFLSVPIYPGKLRGKSTMIIADCRKLPEITNKQRGISLPVPSNSVQGRTLIIKGTPRRRGSSNRVAVNFRTESNILFHVVARFEEGIVARNNYKNDAWVQEEHSLPGSFPFHFDIPFAMEIAVDEIGYHCQLDGTKLFTFKHRDTSLGDLETVDVVGSIDVSLMSFN